MMSISGIASWDAPATPNGFTELAEAAGNPEPLFNQLIRQGFASIGLNENTMRHLQDLNANARWAWPLSARILGDQSAFATHGVGDPFQAAVRQIFQALWNKMYQQDHADGVFVTRSELRRHVQENEFELLDTRKKYSVIAKANKARAKACSWHTDDARQLFSAVVAIPHEYNPEPLCTEYLQGSHTEAGYDSATQAVRHRNEHTLYRVMPANALNIWCAAGVRVLANVFPYAQSFFPLLHRSPFCFDPSILQNIQNLEGLQDAEKEAKAVITTHVFAVFTGTLQSIVDFHRMQS